MFIKWASQSVDLWYIVIDVMSIEHMNTMLAVAPGSCRE